MYGVLRRHEEQSGADYQDRLFLSFDKMFSREKMGPLGEFFDYWKSRRNEHLGMPTIDSFRPKDEMLSGNSRAITLVDVTNSDPANFMFYSHPQYTRGFFDLSRRRLGDHPSRERIKRLDAGCIEEAGVVWHWVEGAILPVVRTLTQHSVSRPNRR